MLNNTTRLRIFVPTQAPTLLEWPFQEHRGSDLTTSSGVSDVSAPTCTQRADRGGAEGAQAPLLAIRILMLIFLVFHQHSTVHRVNCKMFFGSTTGVATHSLSNRAVMNLRFEKY